jgi:hypothetical protein
MEQTLLISIAIACAVILWTEGLPIIKFIKFALKRKSLKPFDCETCLSFWLGVIYSVCYYNSLEHYQCLFIIFATPFISKLILKYVL